MPRGLPKVFLLVEGNAIAYCQGTHKYLAKTPFFLLQVRIQASDRL